MTFELAREIETLAGELIKMAKNDDIDADCIHDKAVLIVRLAVKIQEIQDGIPQN